MLVLEKLGVARALEGCRELLRYIDEEMKNPVTSSDELDDNPEGIPHAKEALEIYQRDDDILGQADCWKHLARLLYEDEQPEAAGEAASRAIELSDKGDLVAVTVNVTVSLVIYPVPGAI